MLDMLRYSEVPKDLEENLEWRRYLWLECSESAEARKLIEESIKHDCLFWMASFVFIFDERRRRAAPFYPWPHEEDLIRQLNRQVEEAIADEDFLENHDLGVFKSRDQGITWTVEAWMDWYCRTHDDVLGHCISMKEENVDNADDMKALFQRLDYIDMRLPKFLQMRGAKSGPKVGRTHLKISYPHTRSVLTGESSNPNAGRQGRYLFALRDEEASCENGMAISAALSDTTQMQIRVSSSKGSHNSHAAAYIKAKTGEGGIKWMEFHWSHHPIYSKGLYSVDGKGQVTIIDTEWHKEHPGYHFQTLGSTYADPGVVWERLRSPWFDNKCEAADNMMIIAQEQQMSLLMSDSPYFRPETLATLRSTHAHPPTRYGVLTDFFPECKVPDLDGRSDKCKAWYVALHDGKPPQATTYCLGVDIAAGSGASDSVISVGDDTTKRKVFEYKSNGVLPSDLSEVTAAIYRHFSTPKGTPFLAWDGSGHGLPYAQKLRSIGGFRIYYHTNRATRKPKRAQSPGVFMNKDMKRETFDEFRHALTNELYISPSVDFYTQAEQFKETTTGIWHQGAKAKDQASSDVGEQHGDIVTSEVILWRAMSTRPAPTPASAPAPKRNTWAWRDQEFREKQKQLSEAW